MLNRAQRRYGQGLPTQAGRQNQMMDKDRVERACLYPFFPVSAVTAVWVYSLYARLARPEANSTIMSWASSRSTMWRTTKSATQLAEERRQTS
jgi:hypothetical protein